MRVFIYEWEILDNSPRFTIFGHGLNDCMENITISVTGYNPYCYFPLTNSDDIERMAETSGVYPLRVDRKTMASTANISAKAIYMRVEFATTEEMRRFCAKTWNKCMDEVDPITAFLSYHQFPFVGWFEMDKWNEKNGYFHVSVRKLRALREETAVTHPKICCIDIETVSNSGAGMPKPYKRCDRIEMVSIICKKYLDDTFIKYMVYIGDGIQLDGVTCIGCANEVELIEEMANIIRKEDPNIITGYNIFGFDMGYILARMKLRLLPLPNMSRGKYGKTTTQKVNWSSSAYGQNVYDRIEVSGRVFIDLMLFFRRMKLDKYSLDFVSRTYLGDGKKDMSPETMFKYFRNRDLDGLRLVAEYCIHDSMLTLLLFDKFFMWTEVCEMARAMHCSIEDIYTRGEQLKVLNQVIFKCVQRDIVLAKRRERPVDAFKYEGAFVLEPKFGIFEGCTVVDFQSLYPSVLISYNFCPSTYVHPKQTFIKDVSVVDVNDKKTHRFRKHPIGLLPDLAQELLNERFIVKAQLKDATGELTRKVLDRRQNALKICANSIYGITGFASNKYFGHVPTAESITCMGRRMLENTVKKIGDNFDVTVVYGDTDSCMIWHNGETDREKNIQMANKIIEHINRELPKPLKLLVEKYYEKMAFLTKKRYLMYDGEVKTKGVANSRRNYCTFTRNLYANTIKLMFERDEDEVFEYVFDQVMRLIHGRVPLEELIMTKSVKPLESYKSTSVPHVIMYRRLIADGNVVELGNRLEYLFVDLGYKCKLQGQKMFTPQEVVSKSLTVDYLYYVEKQLIIAMDELLSLLKREKYISDLYNRHKYMRGW
jgi:DNA polymerase elongation subunit (family B)